MYEESSPKSWTLTDSLGVVSFVRVGKSSFVVALASHKMHMI